MRFAFLVSQRPRRVVLKHLFGHSSHLLSRKGRLRPECLVLFASGAPDTIRTCGLRLRRATLYPAELRVHIAYAVLTRILCDVKGLGTPHASL